jgi:hypothetical protein
MFTLRIQHSVPDFGRWKQVFDSDPADRKGSGVHAYRVLRSVADPSLVMIDLDFDSLSEAEGLLEKMNQIWAGPGRSIMQNPRAHIAETVETVEVSRAVEPL